MWPIGMPMGIAPRKPCWAGDGNLALQQFVVGLQIPVGDGPVGPHSIFRVNAKVGGMKPRSKGGPMDRASTNPFAAVVRTERQRMGSAGNAQIVPIEFAGSFLVANP